MNTKTVKTDSLTFAGVYLNFPMLVKHYNRADIHASAVKAYLSNPNCPDVMDVSNYDQGERELFFRYLELFLQLNAPKISPYQTSSPQDLPLGRWDDKVRGSGI